MPSDRTKGYKGSWSLLIITDVLLGTTVGGMLLYMPLLPQYQIPVVGLKHGLASTPVLPLPYPKLQFLLEVDASGEGGTGSSLSAPSVCDLLEEVVSSRGEL